MSYNLTLPCGCRVCLSSNRSTRLAHKRILESRAAGCKVRRHQVGLRLRVWELLPEPVDRPRVEWADDLVELSGSPVAKTGPRVRLEAD